MAAKLAGQPSRSVAHSSKSARKDPAGGEGRICRQGSKRGRTGMGDQRPAGGRTEGSVLLVCLWLFLTHMQPHIREKINKLKNIQYKR